MPERPSSGHRSARPKPCPVIAACVAAATALSVSCSGEAVRHRTIAFTFADNTAWLQVRAYISTMTAWPVSLSDHTYVEWSSRFDCDEADEDKTISQVRDGVLTPGLRALKQRFGSAGS